MQIVASPDHSDLSWRDRIDALKQLPPFIRLLYANNPYYVGAVSALRLVRAGLPVGLLWVGKLIIEVVENHHHTGEPLEWTYLGALLLLELGLAIGADAIARASSLLETLLGDSFSNKMSIKLMRHASRLDLAQFEDPTVYDRLERARSQTLARVSLLVRLLDTVQALVTLVLLVAALTAFVPWLLVLLAVSVIPAFLGESHFAGLEYSLQVQWTPERRKLDYLRSVAASNQTAKEVKLFGLSRFLIDRYATIAWKFYEASKRLSTRRALVSIGLAGVSTIGYYGAYGIIIYLTTIEFQSPAGIFTIGVLTFLAASFRQSRALIQQILLAMSGIYHQSLYIRDLLLFFEIEPRLGSRQVAIEFRNPSNRVFVSKVSGSDTLVRRNGPFAISAFLSLLSRK